MKIVLHFGKKEQKISYSKGKENFPPKEIQLEYEQHLIAQHFERQ